MESTVLLAEGNELVRRGLSCFLAQSRRFRRIHEASTAQEALEVATRDRIHVAVVGMSLAEGSTRELAERLGEETAQTRFVVILRDESLRERERAGGKGVLGVLGSGSSARELLEAIDRAVTGRRYLSPELDACLLAGTAGTGGKEARGGETADQLTARERTVLRLIGEGESNRGIAERLGVSTRTVDTHRLKLMRKLGIHKTVGLVRLAIREGFVEA